MGEKVEIECPICRNCFSLKEQQLIRAGYKKAIAEMKTKLEIMETIQ